MDIRVRCGRERTAGKEMRCGEEQLLAFGGFNLINVTNYMHVWTGMINELGDLYKKTRQTFVSFRMFFSVFYFLRTKQQ